MRLPDFSNELPKPTPDMPADEKGKLLLRYVNARQPVAGLLFNAASLQNADLRGADLAGAVLDSANLFSADLQQANLSGASLKRCNLQRARLIDVDLRNAQLTGASLESALIGGADLRFATLENTRLQYANLLHADLSDAVLKEANLQRARLRQAILHRADLSGANLRWADLLMADLEEARIDHQTIRNSAWSRTDVQHYRDRGLQLASAAPRAVSPSPKRTAPIDNRKPREGLRLRFARTPSPVEATSIALLVAAWREIEVERTAELDPHHLPLVITADDPDELDALCVVMRERRWQDIGLHDLIQPDLVRRLVQLIREREAFELWVEKSDGVRKVLEW